MSTISCDVYRIVFKKKNILPVLLELEILGILEPLSPIFAYNNPEFDEQIVLMKRNKESAKRAITFLDSYKKQTGESEKIVVSASNLRRAFKNSKKVLTKIDEILALEIEIAQEKEQVEHINQKTQELEDINHLETILPASTSLYKYFLAKVDVNTLENVRYEIKENELVSVEDLFQNQTDHYVMFVYDTHAQQIVGNIIEKQKIKPFDIVLSQDQTIKSYYESLLQEKSRHTERLVSLEKKSHEYSQDSLQEIKIFVEMLNVTTKAYQAIEFVGFSYHKKYLKGANEQDKLHLKNAFSEENVLNSHITKSKKLHIDGWLIPTNLSILKNAMKKIDENIKVTKLDRNELSESRSSLENNAIMRPFEFVTGLMGMPNSNEIDPSPYVAPFFIAFFGFALGDAGYGVVMTVVTLYALLKMKLAPSAREAVKLMLYCGISTIFFGALTGGWFGADLNAIGSVGRFLAQFKVLDISTNIMLVLIGSLVVGFIHQIFGLVLRAYSDIKNGNVEEALSVPGTWILFLFTLVGFGIKETLGLSDLPWGWIVGIVFVIFSFGQGYGTKNVFLRPLKGSMSIFGITSYLSNTLSYARLLALGLATGVIASVVNLLASIFTPDIPVLGFIIASFILVLGHAFNLVLNLVGTFINVIRLHLVEFFPHFFEARGLEIKPFKVDNEYVIVPETIHALDLLD